MALRQHLTCMYKTSDLISGTKNKEDKIIFCDISLKSNQEIQCEYWGEIVQNKGTCLALG